jgi:hypothetical protein
VDVIKYHDTFFAEEGQYPLEVTQGNHASVYATVGIDHVDPLTKPEQDPVQSILKEPISDIGIILDRYLSVKSVPASTVASSGDWTNPSLSCMVSPADWFAEKQGWTLMGAHLMWRE